MCLLKMTRKCMRAIRRSCGHDKKSDLNLDKDMFDMEVTTSFLSCDHKEKAPANMFKKNAHYRMIRAR